MKKPLVPFAWAGWLRSSFRAVRNRLFQALLNRFIPGFFHDPFRLPFVVPMRAVSFPTNAYELFSAQQEGVSQPFHQDDDWSDALSELTSCAVCQRCAGNDSVAFAGNTLTTFPAWRYN